jgi:hypothetical protein
MKDIDKSSITIGAGSDVELTENPAYSGDWLFGYFGYAPLDWLEFGIASHIVDITIYPAVEAKIDVIDIFSDSSRFSCLLMGGIGGLPGDLSFYHAGLTMNLRLSQYLQLYLGAGSDSISKALNLQAGAYLVLLKWLGISMNFKLVTGPEGTELMPSVAPLATFRLDKGE